MCDAPQHLREDWLYESIADPDCPGWNCPTCDYCNYHVYGLKECERCGFQLDPDRVHQALTQRELSGLTQELLSLVRHWTVHEDIPKSQQHKCRAVGQEIEKLGGMDAMVAAYREARAANPAASVVQAYWDGIGDWQW